MQRTVSTTCPYCGVGCGIRAGRSWDGAVEIAGDAGHPANRGRLCSKGTALAETLGPAGRLLHPLWRGERVSWDRALTIAAEGLAHTIDEHGPDAVAFYVSGQLLTEDYYVANKLCKGFLGTANIDTNSRLCMASSVAGHRRAFGADVVPASYADLDAAELVVLAGSNAAWCHPILFDRIARARAAHPERRLVVIDPRRTRSSDAADLHLALRPGSDAVLFAGLLVHLAETGRIDREFLERHTAGADATLGAARAAAPSLASIAERCGVPVADLHRFYGWFAESQRAMTLYSQGINQSSSGTDKVTAILNCHLLTGRIGKPGAGPLSLTGQPNAMGGREVGGLANQLAAHLEIDNPVDRDIARRFWHAPALAERAGLKAVEMFDALAEGRIRALWIMSTNPVVTMPEAERVRAALKRCPLVIVSDCMRDTDTTRCADLLLPALAWGEKDGTVTNSERRISRQRAFLEPPGEARADWRIIAEVAQRLGFARSFAYRSAADIFREHARLSEFENDGSRAFDIGGLAEIDDAGYEALTPVQWPVPRARPQGTERLFAEGGFFTADRRARLVPVTPRPPRHPLSAMFPLLLNTGRLRDQWHTMTRSGRSPSLAAHEPEPFLAVHPADTAIADGELVRVISAHGEAVLRLRHSAEQPRGSVFAPIHWGTTHASDARIGAVVNAATDPISGQPELKHTPVRVERRHPRWQAFLATRRRLPAGALEGIGWTQAVTHDGWRYELAGDEPPADWEAWARRIFPEARRAVQWLTYEDPAAGSFRYARLVGDRLDACLFVAPQRPAIARDWLVGLFAEPSVHALRLRLLSGEPPPGTPDAGKLVCVCCGIGERVIEQAIRERRLDSVEAIGEATTAGTNCGSCKPELRLLLRRVEEPAPSS
ncbi:MAG TPA: molybdopterin-dependent oxidoreductase [Stellaceae bacterium]|nr:molybdopterin-dependent oxidoreductase [Stellaceae bacterium]